MSNLSDDDELMSCSVVLAVAGVVLSAAQQSLMSSIYEIIATNAVFGFAIFIVVVASWVLTTCFLVN